MRIAVLDGYTLNPGDLTWEALEDLGPCSIYDRTATEDVVARAAGHAIVLTNKTPLTRAAIEQLPDLRYIGVLATGFNIVDVEAARERHIPVTNVPDYATYSAAQMVFAHLTNLTLHPADHGRSVTAGQWSRSPDFCYWNSPLVELAGLTMGIVGFGRIGRATARIATAMGMNVITCNRTRPNNLPDDVRFVDLDTLFRQSDVVTLHCPLTPDTKHLVNAERIGLMKPSAYLINVGRGPLVDEAALAHALNSGRIAGAGIDVLSIEPPPADHPLLHAANCCITPHIAWATQAARRRLLATVIDNVRAFLAGTPQNVVNG